jgi:hypothetical protein
MMVLDTIDMVIASAVLVIRIVRIVMANSWKQVVVAACVAVINELAWTTIDVLYTICQNLMDFYAFRYMGDIPQDHYQY